MTSHNQFVTEVSDAVQEYVSQCQEHEDPKVRITEAEVHRMNDFVMAIENGLVDHPENDEFTALGCITDSISRLLMSHISDLDGEEPNNIIQAVLEPLDDFVTDMSVTWTRTVVTEEGTKFEPVTFETN